MHFCYNTFHHIFLLTEENFTPVVVARGTAVPFPLNYSFHIVEDVPGPGDADDLDTVDSTTARLILQCEVSLLTLTDTQSLLANVNGDDRVARTGARLILQREIKLLSHF